MVIIYLILEVISGFLAVLPFIVFIQFMLTRGFYKKEMMPSYWHLIGVYGLIFILVSMLSVTGIPSIYNLHFVTNINWIPFKDITTNSLQYILNIILFVPLGLVIPLLWKRFASLQKTFRISFLFSLTIELSQLFNFRTTDIDDLLMNTLGGVIGFYLFKFVKHICPSIVQKIQLVPPPTYTANKLIKFESNLYIWITWLATLTLQPIVSNFIYSLFF